MEHCFLFRQVFWSFCFVVNMDFARNLPHAINREVKKEGFLCLLRSSQALFADGFITPWKHGSPSVQEIPVTKFKSLEEARRMLTVRQVHQSIKEIEIATELSRFRNSFLKLGKKQKNRKQVVWFQ